MQDDTNDPEEDPETSSNGSMRTVSTIDTTSAPAPAPVPVPAPLPAPTAKTTAPSSPSPPALLSPAPASAPAPSPVETEGVSNKSSTVATAAASSFKNKFHEARQSATAATITANVKAQQVKAATTAKFAAFRHSYGERPSPANANTNASPSPSSLTPGADAGAAPPLSSRLNRITAAKTWQSWTTKPKPSLRPSMTTMGNRWKSFTATVPIPTTNENENEDEDEDGNVGGTPPTPAVVRDKWKNFTAGVKAKANNYTTNTNNRSSSSNTTISMSDGLQEPQQEPGGAVRFRPRLNDRLKSFTTTITTSSRRSSSSHVEGQEQDTANNNTEVTGGAAAATITDDDDDGTASVMAGNPRWQTVTTTLKTTVHDSLQEVRTDLAVLKQDSAKFFHQAGTKLDEMKSTTSAKLAVLKTQVEQSRQNARNNNDDGGRSSLFEGINFMPHHPTTTDDDHNDGGVNLQQAAILYRAPMQTLRAMGLATTTSTEHRCLELLHHTRGNVDQTVDMILADNNHEPAPNATTSTTPATTNLEPSSTASTATATATVAGTTITDETSSIEESVVEISSSSDTPATASPTFVID